VALASACFSEVSDAEVSDTETGSFNKNFVAAVMRVNFLVLVSFPFCFLFPLVCSSLMYFMNVFALVF